MEAVTVDNKGKIRTEAVKINPHTIVRKKFLKEFHVREDLTYNEFLEIFLSTANMMVDDYQVTDEIEFILINVFNQITGREFYKIDPGGAKVKAEERDRQKGLFVAGPTGTGKTTFCRILFNMFRYSELKYTYNDKVYTYSTNVISEQQINREYIKNGSFAGINCNCLLIDDIGQSKEINYMGNKMDPIREIITERYDVLRYSFTSFTSNYPINHRSIIDQYGERVADRLLAMANYYIINAKNFRK